MNHDIDRTQVGYAGENEGAGPYSRRPVFNQRHMQLAGKLMDVNSEQEFEDFLGDVISGAAQSVGKFINSPTGQALGSGLKDVAKQLLPVAGTAVGDYFGGSAGGQIGGALGTAASNLIGEVPAEEMEWEAANTFVNLASDAAKKVAEAGPGADPHAIAKHAIVEAAKIHAPHLVPVLTGEHGGCHCGHHHHHHHHHQHSGHWYRHGERIVLVGV